MAADRPDESAPRTDGHAPLLWLAVPLVWGYILAHTLGGALPVWGLAALGLAVGAAALVLTCREGWFVRPVWGFLILTAGVLLAWAYYLVREPSSAPVGDFIPREGEVVLEVGRLFQTNPKYARISGLGTIVTSPAWRPQLAGQAVAFSLWTEGIEEGGILPGALIRARGKIARLDTKPDLNDFEQYLVNSGYPLQLSQGSLLGVERPAGAFRQWCRSVNRRLAGALGEGAVSPDTRALAGVATAMFLGDKAALGREQKETFIASGTMHLFAVSGLHVGIIAGTLALALRLVRVSGPVAAVVGLGLLFFYVQVIGVPPSALRAFLMVAFYWGAQVVRRKPAPFSALLASAVAVLLIDPRQLFGAGFQLSYLIVAALLLYAVPLTEWANARLDPYRLIPLNSLRRWQRFLRWAMRGLNASLAVSATAFIFATPLTVAYFHIFAPGAIFLNLILVPLATGVIVLALVSGVLGLAGAGAVCVWINTLSWAVVWEMWTVVSAAVAVPGGFWQARFAHEWLAPLTTLLLLGSLLVVARRARTRPVVYLLPVVILAPVLVFGVNFAKL
ncbi:ComEC/Rec2 family competence protein [Ruficoccus amylovorans]|uniref:ComEC/Rec2 family competence protein n=1 Tax=Ruficoccus amylovorans TaxID=1804625 RepID=A0A842HFJ6_9BACT|nr:ComEC/Rec2 family competence protein [Ruficoccus amylovorans]MBC2594294.1 ComEC/Rec2 family competence protein [Ruficoccus amylovorans]